MVLPYESYIICLSIIDLLFLKNQNWKTIQDIIIYNAVADPIV